jgi:hypothetical protein
MGLFTAALLIVLGFTVLNGLFTLLTPTFAWALHRLMDKVKARR